MPRPALALGPLFAALLLAAGPAAGYSPPCQCYRCCGKPLALNTCPVLHSANSYCSGPSTGCLGGSGSGCFGGAEISIGGGAGRDFVGGECVCSTGQFRQPERWRLMGYASSVPAGMELTLMATIGVPFTTAKGGSGTRMQSWQTVTVTKSGQFRFPNRLVQGHSYFITVKSITLNGRAASSRECLLTHGFEGTARGDVTDLQIKCATHKQHMSAAEKAADAQQAQLEETFSQDKIGAPDCQDSPLLFRLSGAMSAKDRAAVKQDTKLPCKRSFTIHPDHKSKDGLYITEMRGQPCVKYEVKSDQPVHACFVEDAIWYQLGPTAAMRDPKLCPCRGTRDCKHSHSGLDPKATYLLFVKESKDRSKLHYHSYSDFQNSFTPLHMVVYAEACTAAATKKKLLVGGGVLVASLAVFLVTRSGSKKGTKGYSAIGTELSSRS